MSTPAFSIVIPSCNRPESLAQCLRRLLPDAQQLPPGLYEVVVSDDSTGSETESLVKTEFPAVTWTRGPRRGPAANRNHGARSATAPWIVFFDDDCLPDPNCLPVYLAAIKNNKHRVLEGRIYADRPRARYDEESPLNETGDCLWACNFAIEKSLFEVLGGFDENFPFAAMEDIDLLVRIKTRAEPILFLPEAAVCHPWRSKKSTEKYRKALASYRYFIQKHYARDRMGFRLMRAKLFIGGLPGRLSTLAGLQFSGVGDFLRETAFLLRLIFL